MTARQVAYEVVRRVFEEDAYADRVFRGSAEGLEERDRAFAMHLAYGTVQHVRTLDHAIETLGKRPVRKLDPAVRAALRLGAIRDQHVEAAEMVEHGIRQPRPQGRDGPLGAGSCGLPPASAG